MQFALPIPAQLIFPLILLVLDLLVVVYCLEDLLKSERHVAGDNKALWAVIIFSGIDWIFYLLYGRVKA